MGTLRLISLIAYVAVSAPESENTSTGSLSFSRKVILYSDSSSGSWGLTAAIVGSAPPGTSVIIERDRDVFQSELQSGNVREAIVVCQNTAVDEAMFEQVTNFVKLGGTILAYLCVSHLGPEATGMAIRGEVLILRWSQMGTTWGMAERVEHSPNLVLPEVLNNTRSTPVILGVIQSESLKVMPPRVQMKIRVQSHDSRVNEDKSQVHAQLTVLYNSYRLTSNLWFVPLNERMNACHELYDFDNKARDEFAVDLVRDEIRTQLREIGGPPAPCPIVIAYQNE